MRVANSRSSNAGALNMSATDAAKMRGASAATGMAGSASAATATATAGGGRLGVGDQQHTDRNDRSENAAFASHKDEPPMANV
jgi:hypothetical protein